MLAKLAWRNVLRNRRRSAITVLSIAIGLAALTFIWAFIDGQNDQMIRNSTRFLAGDVQVHLKGYHNDPTLDLTMADALPVLASVRADPNVAAATVRMEGKALASRADKSRGIMLVGVDPREEPQVSALFNAVVSGQPLTASTPGVLIGEQLAQALGLAAGDELLLVGQGYDGSLASGRYPVHGAFRTRIDELDGRVAVLPLAVVRDFFVAPAGATAIALRLRELAQLDATETRLAQRLGPRYEVLGWPRLLPMVAVSTRFHDVIGWVVLAVFFGIVAAAVANPILMAVIERTREFGIMLALGTSRARLLGLVLTGAARTGGGHPRFGRIAPGARPRGSRQPVALAGVPVDCRSQHPAQPAPHGDHCGRNRFRDRRVRLPVRLFRRLWGRPDRELDPIRHRTCATRACRLSARLHPRTGLRRCPDTAAAVARRAASRSGCAALADTLPELRRRIGATGLSLAPWQALLPQIDEMVRLVRVFSNIMLAFAFIVIAMAIMNTVFMAVAERTREFGVMMALGTPPAAIQRMVVYETLALMLLASFIGYGLGFMLVAYFGRHGIDLSGFFRGYSAIPGLTGVIHPKLLAGRLAVPGLVLFTASVLVSLYPASRAARLGPVRAIRHV